MSPPSEAAGRRVAGWACPTYRARVRIYRRVTAREAGFDQLTPKRGVVVPIDGGAGDAFGVICDENPLSMKAEAAARCLLLSEPTPGGRLIAWSGSAGESMFARNARSWMPESRHALEAMCDALAPGLAESGRRLVFRPNARHVLSDAHACRAFLEAHHEQPIGVLLDPIGMLEPELLDQAEDHFGRWFEALGASCEGVVLSGGRVEGDRLAPAPFGEGDVESAPTLELLRAHSPPDVSVLLLEGATESALAGLIERA